MKNCFSSSRQFQNWGDEKKALFALPRPADDSLKRFGASVRSGSRAGGVNGSTLTATAITFYPALRPR